MCIGTPMQVVQAEAHHAWCEADGRRERLDMALIGMQPPGTWVLAFQGTARQVMGPEEAAFARDARRALAAALAGETDMDAFFADLVGREPQLPAHLQPPSRIEP
jgi:hydrogenase expression/formation protein HypC